MKEQVIKKINKIGKISSVMALIAKILVGVALAATLAATVICFVLPRNLVDVTLEGSTIVEVDLSSLGVQLTQEEWKESFAEFQEEEEGVIFEITETGIRQTETASYFSLNMRDCAGFALWGTLVLGITFVTIWFIGSLCKAFRDCQSPFEANVIKKMQNMAYSLIPWTIVSTVTNSISKSMVNNKISLMFSIDLGAILIVLVVLVLVCIFKYGAVLQQESDETL